jgi:hypothetical protein
MSATLKEIIYSVFPDRVELPKQVSSSLRGVFNSLSPEMRETVGKKGKCNVYNNPDEIISEIRLRIAKPGILNRDIKKRLTSSE